MIPTIGLEIHAELKTRTKMFCACPNDFDEKHPNINVCPICLGHPGTLSTINKQAVESVVRLGLALGGRISDKAAFDRKSYFYPDLPKGYQISQYKHPLVSGGTLKGIRIRRIHLEEDTGRLIHPTSNSQSPTSTLVDFNRAGVPLMELVTEPDIKSAQEAVDFAKELHLVLRYLGISDADMEKGHMRIEANVSLGGSRIWAGPKRVFAEGEAAQISLPPLDMGTKTELKNINSFRAAGEAIAYELKRQKELIEKGRKVIQETRGWNDDKKITELQRTKEEAHDYRYFPEPDLPPMHIPSAFNLENLKAELPELPSGKRARLVEQYGLNKVQAEVLVADKEAASYFEESVSELQASYDIASHSRIFSYLTSDLFGLMKEGGIGFSDLQISPAQFACLIALIEENKITSRTAKDVLKEMVEVGGDPEQIVKKEGLGLVSDVSVIRKVAEEVIRENPSAVADYQKGKSNALQFLIGKSMIKFAGSGDTAVIKVLLEELLTKK